jgi:hypothetical protein
MLTYAREKFGLVGEMSITGFISILIVVLTTIGGSYAFTLTRTDTLLNKLEIHTAQLASIQASIDLLLRDRGIDGQKIRQGNEMVK